MQEEEAGIEDHDHEQDGLSSTKQQRSTGIKMNASFFEMGFCGEAPDSYTGITEIWEHPQHQKPLSASNLGPLH